MAKDRSTQPYKTVVATCPECNRSHMVAVFDDAKDFDSPSLTRVCRDCESDKKKD